MRCVIQQFAPNAYNFAPMSLRFVDSTKGRGVFADRDVPEGTVLALFPGREVHRIPARGALPRDAWDERGARDETMIDEVAWLLPLSDYSITCGVLDLDDAGLDAGFESPMRHAMRESPTRESPSTREVGYHYRILDPMAEDVRGAARLDALWQQLAELDYWFSDEPAELPAALVEVHDLRAQLLYARLALATWRTLRRLPQPDLKLYEFVLDPSEGEVPRVKLHVNGRLFFVCEEGDCRDRDYALGNIRLALNTEYDVKRQRKLDLAARAKALKLSDDYPHAAAFINQPYKHERANCAFVDPHEWVGRVSHMDAARHPQHAALIRETREPLTPARLDYLQRQAVVATRPIRRGEELLIDYKRSPV